jgi:hypothetical protein
VAFDAVSLVGLAVILGLNLGMRPEQLAAPLPSSDPSVSTAVCPLIPAVLDGAGRVTPIEARPLSSGGVRELQVVAPSSSLQQPKQLGTKSASRRHPMARPAETDTGPDYGI